jgi:hypothetical protein
MKEYSLKKKKFIFLLFPFHSIPFSLSKQSKKNLVVLEIAGPRRAKNPESHSVPNGA